VIAPWIKLRGTLGVVYLVDKNFARKFDKNTTFSLEDRPRIAKDTFTVILV